jgi:hypothetical protein
MRAIILAAFALAPLGQALAQERGPNGGLLSQKSGDHQVELLVSPNQITVLEKGKAHGTTGAILRAVVAHAGKTATVPLVQQNGKRLVGKLDAPLAKGATVLVTGQDQHKHAISGRFVVP